jgi:hypothetical protein
VSSCRAPSCSFGYDEEVVEIDPRRKKSLFSRTVEKGLSRLWLESANLRKFHLFAIFSLWPIFPLFGLEKGETEMSAETLQGFCGEV